VAVMALGTDEFPAFFTRASGVDAPATVECAADAAAVAHAQVIRHHHSSFIMRNVPCVAPPTLTHHTTHLIIRCSSLIMNRLSADYSSLITHLSTAQAALGLQSGMLVGVPIPAEAEAEAAVVQQAIDQVSNVDHYYYEYY